MFPWVEQGEVFGKAVVPRFGLGHEKMKAAFSTDMLNLNNNNKKKTCRWADESSDLLQRPGDFVSNLAR